MAGSGEPAARGRQVKQKQTQAVFVEALSEGTLNAFLKQKGQTSSEGPVWSLNGNQGDHWKQAKVSIHPTSSFQVVLEGIRGPGIEGDIAIDDVTLEEGECRDPPTNLSSKVLFRSSHIWLLCVTLVMTLLEGQR
ncbi:MAM domain-containing glycosylphosphatidylinositol anchor protein 2 [Takifugu flavidus]|uniref:MAM domain-containing glycosylphosphatidylinositol anchor protein 2 n=1 Tax=Takifugu flavidus TaxID=433684 RepID=A0A5C6NQ43_9TELE|nr:MAM domain-containing glycosylphosphatidylinositol anchor protein 2 [Takifugu flavidus]